MVIFGFVTYLLMRWVKSEKKVLKCSSYQPLNKSISDGTTNLPGARRADHGRCTIILWRNHLRCDVRFRGMNILCNS